MINKGTKVKEFVLSVKQKFFIYSFFLLLFSCGKVEKFEFKKIENWYLDESGLNVQLLLYNPNTFRVTLKHMEGAIAVAGKDIGFCLSDTVVRIMPHQNFVLPVNIRLKSGGLLGSSLYLLTQDSLLVKFSGFVRVGRSGIFIKYKISHETKVPIHF